MYCPKCGASINQGEFFCGNCGTKINSQEVNNNQNNGHVYGYDDYSYDNYNSNSNMYTLNMHNSNQELINNENLIRAYVGNNADKITSGKFSICTFLFGIYYVLYRKMWLLGICWFIGSLIVAMFLPTFSNIIMEVLNLVFAISFNKMYLDHVEEQVKKIKLDNPFKTQDELMLICSKKGGTSILATIISIVLCVFLVILIIVPIIFKTIDQYDGYDNDYSMVVEE